MVVSFRTQDQFRENTENISQPNKNQRSKRQQGNISTENSKEEHKGIAVGFNSLDECKFFQRTGEKRRNYWRNHTLQPSGNAHTPQMRSIYLINWHGDARSHTQEMDTLLHMIGTGWMWGSQTQGWKCNQMWQGVRKPLSAMLGYSTTRVVLNLSMCTQVTVWTCRNGLCFTTIVLGLLFSVRLSHNRLCV